MPVDAELAGVGKIRAELDEEWPEVSVHAVEVVVIDHGTGVVDPRNGAPALSEAFADGARDGCLFLRDADEDDTLGGLELPQAFLHHVVFTHPFLETDNLNVLALGKVEHLPAKPLAQCHGVFGRGEPVALVAAEIGSHTARAGRLGDIKVQIHPVDAFQLEDNVFTLEFATFFGEIMAVSGWAFVKSPHWRIPAASTAQSGILRGRRYAAPARRRPLRNAREAA